MKTIIIYLLAQKAALTLAALLAGYPCWQCGSTQQNNAVQSFFFSTLAGGSIAPSAPANLAATPGDTQVGLSWTASAGATGYNVKRSLINGGPYVTIAPNVAGTNYTNVGLTNGTTYYYVVTAIGSGGESSGSNQVSATPAVASCVVFNDTSFNFFEYIGFNLTPCLQFPNLTTVANGITIQSDSSLASVTFGAGFVIGSSGISISSNPLLTTITFGTSPSMQDSEFLIFSGNALSQVTVDYLLQFCVNSNALSGTLQINGGTSSTPSGAGLANKAILVARSWQIFNN